MRRGIPSQLAASRPWPRGGSASHARCRSPETTISQATVRDKALLSILALGLLLRLLFLHLAVDIPLIYDEIEYWKLARELLETGRYRPDSIWAPGQPFYLAAIFLVFGESVLAARCVGVVLSVASVWLVHDIAQRAFRDRGVALLASALAACYPALIAFSHYLWSETLFVFLLLASVDLLLRAGGSRRPALLVASALCFAAGGLTRPVLLYAAPAFWVYLFAKARRDRALALRSILVFSVSVLVFVSPWVVRNYRVHHSFVLVSGKAGLNLWWGNDRLLGRPVGHEPFSREKYYAAGSTMVEREKHALRVGLDLIRQEQPLWIVKKSLMYARSWHVGSSILLRNVRAGLYGKLSTGVEGMVTLAIQFAYLVVACGAIVGFVYARYDAEQWLFVLWCACVAGISILTIATTTRLRIPLVPFLVMFSALGYRVLGRAALGWIRRRRAGPGPEDLPARSRGRVRPWLAGAGLALFGLNSVVDVTRLAARFLP